MVSRQLYYTISSEELFDFNNKKMPYLCGFRRFANAYIDMKVKGMSKGEYNSVKQAVGGLDAMLDKKCKDKDALALIKYIADEEKDEKVLENQKVLKTPIVRNGKLATIGYCPDIWKNWNEKG